MFTTPVIMHSISRANTIARSTPPVAYDMEALLHDNGSATEVLPNYHPFKEDPLNDGDYSLFEKKDTLRRFSAYLISFRPHLDRTPIGSVCLGSKFRNLGDSSSGFFFFFQRRVPFAIASPTRNPTTLHARAGSPWVAGWKRRDTAETRLCWTEMCHAARRPPNVQSQEIYSTEPRAVRAFHEMHCHPSLLDGPIEHTRFFGPLPQRSSNLCTYQFLMHRCTFDRDNALLGVMLPCVDQLSRQETDSGKEIRRRGPSRHATLIREGLGIKGEISAKYNYDPIHTSLLVQRLRNYPYVPTGHVSAMLILKEASLSHGRLIKVVAAGQ